MFYGNAPGSETGSPAKGSPKKEPPVFGGGGTTIATGVK